MAGEDSVRSPEPAGARSAEPARGGSVTLGLIPAPDIPEKIANKIATELPELLGKHVDDRVSWEVSVVVDPLTGTEQEAPDLLDACHERLQREGWDLAVCLTDLPVYRSGRLVVADVSAAQDRGALAARSGGDAAAPPGARGDPPTRR